MKRVQGIRSEEGVTIKKMEAKKKKSEGNKGKRLKRKLRKKI